MSLKYNSLSPELQEQIICDRNEKWVNPFAFRNEDALRRNNNRDVSSILRPPFVRDIEKIIHIPAYNRYADKTQVFSLYSNDDISRRSLHVQLVSRISRNIGSILGLNLDLIEAIALGHDLGHTPFGHAGESYLNEILNNSCGRFFNHNVQSVRVLDVLYKRNLTLQTLDGILCHDGENEFISLTPVSNITFDDLDYTLNQCYLNGIKGGVVPTPSTLEGCVVRISDIIAYLGKDRQDAVKADIISDYSLFSDNYLGKDNAEIINNIIVDVIENSYRKDYISFSNQSFEALKLIKKENYDFIYKNHKVKSVLDDEIKKMFEETFDKLLSDLISGNENSVIYKHHINFVSENCKYYSDSDYLSESPHIIVSDYISSMTDDYFIKLYEFLFPGKHINLKYKSYFYDVERGC